MINRNNKKGFTIVELVIVIAVIEILAAVLIPSFSGIIAKANESADIKAVREMNTALTAEFAVEKPSDIDAVIDALAKNGFNSKKALIPVSKDYKFMWSKEANCIVLLNAENALVFPTGITYANDGVLLEDSDKYIDIKANDANTLADALENGNNTITLDADVTLKNQVKIPANATVTLDLNGNTIKTEQVTGRSKYLDVAGELTIVNGTIEARGIEIMDGGKLIIGKDAKVTVNNVDDNGGAAIWVYKGGEVEINGGTFAATGGDYVNDKSTDLKYEPGVINNSGKITINGGDFSAIKSGCYAVNNSGTLVINSGNFKALRGVIATTAGTVTITGGTFTVTDPSAGGHIIYADGADVVVNITGGTFSSEKFHTGNGATINDTRTK
jgi:type IV pilus assembly protein PilA